MGRARGLDAYIRLLKCLPADREVVIVIVNHRTLVPTPLHQTVPHLTSTPVELITENLVIEPNHGSTWTTLFLERSGHIRL